MSKTGNFLLRRLFKNHKGKCFYCGEKTVLPKSGVNGQSKQVPNLATTEHVYHKTDIRRFLSRKKVLACYTCNNKKGATDAISVYRSSEYLFAYQSEDAQIYNGLLITLLKSKDQTKYLI